MAWGGPKLSSKAEPSGPPGVVVRRVDRLNGWKTVRILVMNEPGSGRLKLRILRLKAPSVITEVRILKVEDYLILKPRENDVNKPGRTLNQWSLAAPGDVPRLQPVIPGPPKLKISGIRSEIVGSGRALEIQILRCVALQGPDPISTRAPVVNADLIRRRDIFDASGEIEAITIPPRNGDV